MAYIFPNIKNTKILLVMLLTEDTLIKSKIQVWLTPWKKEIIYTLNFDIKGEIFKLFH